MAGVRGRWQLCWRGKQPKEKRGLAALSPPPPSTVCMAQALEGRPNMPPSLAQQEPSSSDAKNSVSELLGALYAHTALRSTPGRVSV